MNRQGILLVGGGGHCLSVVEVLESAGLPVAGVVHGPDCGLTPVAGYPALGRDEALPALKEHYDQAVVTVGQIKTPAPRKRLFTLLSGLGYTLPVVAASSAVISRHAAIGKGSVVMHRAVLNAEARVGDNCIINTGAIIEHSCVVGSHCHIAVGALLCGDATIGSGSFIGAGAIIHPGLHIGENCIIGMGVRIRHNLPDGATYVG